MQYNKLYKLLFQAVKEGSVEAVQKAASTIFNSAVSVTDTAFRVLSADTDPGSTDDMIERYETKTYVSEKLLDVFKEHNLISNLIANPHKTIIVNWDYFKKHPHITTGIFWKKQILGSVTVLVQSDKYTKEQDEALQACAEALALVMHNSDFGVNKFSVDKDNFISKLFNGIANEKDLKKASSENLFIQSEKYIILSTEYKISINMQEKISKNLHLLLYTNEEISYLLSDLKSPEFLDLKKQIEKRGYRFGLSYIFSNPLLCNKMSKQANAALKYGNQSGEKKASWSFPEHALDILINDKNNSIDITHPCIIEIEQYDAKNKTEYLKTLKMWLLNKMNYSDTAKALFLHRNSLYYRMQQIQNLFSIDLNNMDTNVQLYLNLCTNNYL